MQDDFTIVGGGTAGFLAALFLNRKYPNSKISLIHSKQIGILGAGEGTTPHFVDFIEHELGISKFQLFKNTNATLKNGIKFVDWCQQPGSYYHGFMSLDDTEFLLDPYFLEYLSVQKEKYEDYNLAYQLALRFKSPYIERDAFNIIDGQALDKNDCHIFNELTKQSSQVALHFDASELAAYLEKIAIERGINVVDDKVVDINTDSRGYITQIETEKNNKHSTKFVIDSTGFNRLILGKKFNTEWISRKDYLPMNEAQPFFLPKKCIKEIEPSTEAIAAAAGWIWKIPLQHRYGCGYVYDNNYCTNEQAIQTIQDTFPSAEIGSKKFKFEAGYYKDTVVNNCFGAGLASSFVEPLEATSLWMFINQLQFAYTNRLFDTALTEVYNEPVLESIKQQVNSYCRETNESVCEFIQYHYLTDKNTSAFWSEFKQKNKIFDSIAARIHLLNNGILDIKCTQGAYRVFDIRSYLIIGSGLNYINVDSIKEKKYNLEDIKASIAEYAERHLTHEQVVVNNKDWIIC